MKEKMTNTELLAYTGQDHLLTQIDRQRRYVLRIESRPMPCPNCGHRMTVWEGLGRALDEHDLSKTHGDDAKCPKCERALRFILPLMGDWHWHLVPIDPKA